MSVACGRVVAWRDPDLYETPSVTTKPLLLVHHLIHLRARRGPSRSSRPKGGACAIDLCCGFRDELAVCLALPGARASALLALMRHVAERALLPLGAPSSFPVEVAATAGTSEDAGWSQLTRAQGDRREAPWHPPPSLRSCSRAQPPLLGVAKSSNVTVITESAPKHVLCGDVLSGDVLFGGGTV
eukprot:CAMPEP_0115508834 /NCGR_PEP_ID=MMETSP0271-20121206/72518_1 /TAXON_ID=71861 /ORGANISM="Scrippsiella trochoidea, Strain CCMP3099" /LENGTH=184 /DNA_ID=CAMNT_0002938613 /DNA_START=114 /DNA_END=666 /DNA_ORIENTATION=-